MKELLLRAGSGLVYVSLVIGSILLAKESFYLLFYLFMLFCLYEFKILIKLSYKWTFLVASLIYLRFIDLSFLDIRTLDFLLIASLFVPFIHQVFRSKVNLTSSKLGQYLLALAYIAIPFALISRIPFINNEYHPSILIGFFIIIWISDSFAYLIGSTLGKTKMYEKISPNKTIEGAIGGFIAAIIAAIIISKYVDQLSILNWIIVAIIINIFGIFGDLIESKFKREAGVKDSSNFIPGHGGFLDRLDSVIFAAPFVYVYLHII